MGDDLDNVKKLPVKFKERHSGETVLKVVGVFDNKCNHLWSYENGKSVNATYLITDGEDEVVCGLCSTRLNPMWVLKKLANKENLLIDNMKKAQETMKVLSKRSCTKCEHCDRMTRISRP